MGPQEEFHEFDRNDSWGVIYQQIRSQASLNHDFSLKDSKRPAFRGRNRYRDVSPYDHSRVRLQRDGVDYINASLVEAPAANRSYILSQGPLPSTCGHFWLLVWEQNTRAVLMLNHVIERGRGPLEETASHFWLMVWEQNSTGVLMLNRVIEKGQVKCHQYFPVGSQNEGEDVMVFTDVDLKVTFLSEDDRNYFTIRTLQLHDLRTGQSKEVLQFHYTTWPDFGVPESPAAFLHFLVAVRDSGALDTDVGPPVIHCSAGIGRSGTFCLVDTCLVLIEQAQDPDAISVLDILMDMRRFRMGLIQTPDQLRFSYLAIIEGSHLVLDSPPIGDDEKMPSLLPQEENAEDSEEVSSPEIASPLVATDLLASLGPPPSAPPPPPPNGNSRAPTTDEEEDIVPPPVPPRNKPVAVDASIDSNGNPVMMEEEEEGQKWMENSVDQAVKSRGSEIRRRQRQDRMKNTRDQLERMKQKQAASEKWKERKTKWKPRLMIGVAVIVVAGGILFYRYFLS